MPAAGRQKGDQGKDLSQAEEGTAHARGIGRAEPLVKGKVPWRKTVGDQRVRTQGVAIGSKVKVLIGVSQNTIDGLSLRDEYVSIYDIPSGDEEPFTEAL